MKFAVVNEFENEFPEEGVLPGKPLTGEYFGIISVEGFVNEACSCVGGHQGADAIPDFIIVG